MKVKAYFFAISLCCMLPFMVQGADLEERDPPAGPPKAPRRSAPMSPIMVETGSGMLTLYFRSDLGEVYVFLEEAGKVAYQQSVDTSIQSQVFLAAPAGTYILTITDAAGNMIKQECIVIS